MAFKFTTDDREYSSWNTFDSKTHLPVKIDGLNPLKERLLNQDIFDIFPSYKTGNVVIVHSTFRASKGIPSVLILEGDKSYGLLNKRKLYKCIPDDARLPVFLVPYEIKQMGFQKKILNKYVNIVFDNWEGKHPIAKIHNSIGDIDKLENFYEYQLYCKSLYSSIQGFTRATCKALKRQSQEEFIANIKTRRDLEDRTDWNIYTIDPKKCSDYDDAFSIKTDAETGETLLSIYISNVTFWMDELDLWDSFSERISTIYLPDKKRPMLPTILSECLCSLVEKETRFGFTLDLTIKNDEIISKKFKNTVIRVKRNLVYDTQEMEETKEYQEVFQTLTSLNNKKEFKYIDSITTSHDVIAYLMIIMNYYSAREMEKNEIGLFRSATVGKPPSVAETLPSDIKKFLTIWQSSGGRYMKFSQEKPIGHHGYLRLDSYVHITSPIRRLVDLLNIIEMQNKLGLMDFTDKSKAFHDYWTSDEMLDYINKTTRVIRRVQCSCDLLHICSTNPETLQKKYSGYIFNKVVRSDKLYQYVVYIHQLHMITKFISRFEFDEYEEKSFRLFLFHDEDKFKKKIRLHLLD